MDPDRLRALVAAAKARTPVTSAPRRAVPVRTEIDVDQVIETDL
ncbi:hypothetical protein BH23ACT7_BH23ACT7_10010 [soil metagenome]